MILPDRRAGIRRRRCLNKQSLRSGTRLRGELATRSIHMDVRRSPGCFDGDNDAIWDPVNSTWLIYVILIWCTGSEGGLVQWWSLGHDSVVMSSLSVGEAQLRMYVLVGGYVWSRLGMKRMQD